MVDGGVPSLFTTQFPMPVVLQAATPMANTLIGYLASISLVILVTEGGSCNEFGVGGSSSEGCVVGLPSLSYILKAPVTDDKIQAVFPGINFTCNGTITKWVVGATWKHGGTTFTELQIWRGSSDSQYTKVNSSNIMVASENDTQVYVLDTPLSFQEGDIFGYFQPSKMTSQTNMYLEITERTTIYYDDDNTPSELFILDDSETDTKHPLIAVTTDPPNCGCGFMSVERIHALLEEPQLNGGGDTKEFDDTQLVIPSFNFVCNGTVVKWIMRGEKWNDNRNQFPELQIWRPTGGNMYQKVNGTQIILTDEHDSEVYEYQLSIPLGFQTGDILGLLQPDKGVSRLRVAYDDDGDSVYYTGTVEDDIFDIEAAMAKTGTPLITLEIIVPHQISPTPSLGFFPITTTMAESTVATTVSTLKQSETLGFSKSSTMRSAIFRTPTTTVLVVSPTVPADEGDNKSTDSSNSGGAGSESVAEIVLGVAVAVLLVIITAIIILFLLRKKKRFRFKHNVTAGVHNPSYGEVVAAKYIQSTDTAQVYPNFHEDSHLYAVPDNEQPYEIPLSKSVEAGEHLEITVPTMGRREIYQRIDDTYFYAETDLKPVIHNDGIENVDGEERTFFTESDIYWVPASNTTELYEQLSKNRFREIQRHHLQVTEHLGSGEFGTVNKGVWENPTSPKNSREVAIKLLQKGASEESQVKFLQEAAIMGQFSHPNIISLLGVVTLGEPVMIVMELMQNGDLRETLLKMRPIPGELPPHSLHQQLLDFCHQIAAGMTYLAEKAFVHRDLAARNILLSGNTCKIADFGMARDLEENTYYTSQGGKIPVKWTAPEAVHYKKYSTASDVWSFGCLVYEVWSLGHKPFENYTNSQVVSMVMTGWRLPPPPGCPREIYRLIIHCWHPEAPKRPQFAHLLQTLSRPEYELLNIPTEEVDKGLPQATILGAPLEVSKNIFTDLQNLYVSS